MMQPGLVYKQFLTAALNKFLYLLLHKFSLEKGSRMTSLNF